VLVIPRCRRDRSSQARRAAQLAEAVDGERRRIAAELHDGLQVQLVLLGLAAQELAADAEPGTASQAMALRAGIDSAAATLRQLVQGFLPPLLAERGLRAATQDLFDRLPVPVRLRFALGSVSLPPAVESTAYFVVAEALTNALKHACARELEVNMEMSGRSVVIDVRDDGVGGAGGGEGNGLASLAKRVGTLGGWLHIESPAGRGTHVRAVLPCASAQ
jgi:signal transduction histidine kinase